MAKRKRTKYKNDLQGTTQKTKDLSTRAPLKPGVNSGEPTFINNSYVFAPNKVFNIYLSHPTYISVSTTNISMYLIYSIMIIRNKLS
jgi:hypothetical protein